MPATTPPQDNPQSTEAQLLGLLKSMYPSWQITKVTGQQGQVSWSVNRITPLTAEERAAGLVDSFTQADLHQVLELLSSQQARRDRNRRYRH